MKIVRAACIVTLAALLVWVGRMVGAGAAPAVRSAVVVSAHRGGAGQWPQNSMLAFRHAVAKGYAEIEADAWRTRDNALVVYHDEKISSVLCPGPYAGRRIWNLTAKQVARVRCSGQPIPTEQQLLQLLAHYPRARLRLEAKTYGGQPAAEARFWAHRVGQPVVARGLASRVIMEDFDWAGLTGFRMASKRLRLSALISKPAIADVQRAARLGAYDLSYSAACVSQELDDAITAAGLVPTVWGIDRVPTRPGHASAGIHANAASAARNAVDLGARVVITNYPDAVTAGLRSV